MVVGEPEIVSYNTPRLRVQHWAAALADGTQRRVLECELAALLTPKVLAPLPPSMQFAQGGDVSHWIENRALESDVLTIRHIETGALIGLLIVAYTKEAGARRQAHLGYLLAETAWGAGYASEVVAGLVAANTAGIDLLGGVGVDNPASARVLRKAGFAKDAVQSTPETDMFLWTQA